MVTLPTGDLPISTPSTGRVVLEWYNALQRIAKNVIPEILFLNQENAYWAVIKAQTAAMGGNVLQLLSFDNTILASIAIHMNGLPTAGDVRTSGVIMGAYDTASRNAAAMTAFSEAAWTSGVSHPINIRLETTASGSASRIERMRVTGAGNVLINTAAIATTATDGFLYVPTCAGVPTGVPTTHTGLAPIVIDSTNNRLYFYSTGAWRNAGP